MNVHTLSIGTNYLGTMSELAGCVNDANDLYSLCKPKVKTATKLIGTKADRQGMVDTFRKVRYRLEKPGDLLFVSLSSHGTNEDGCQGVVGNDFEVIWDYEMDAAIVDRLAGTYVVFLLDCCHADGLKKGRVIGVHMPGPSQKSIPIERCKSHPRLEANTSRAKVDCGFIAGCLEGGYSYDGRFNGRPNGALTYYTLRAWKELKRGATFNDLFNRIGGKRPKGYLPSVDYPQQPTKFGSAKNFARKMPFK